MYYECTQESRNYRYLHIVVDSEFGTCYPIALRRSSDLSFCPYTNSNRTSDHLVVVLLTTQFARCDITFQCSWKTRAQRLWAYNVRFTCQFEKNPEMKTFRITFWGHYLKDGGAIPSAKRSTVRPLNIVEYHLFVLYFSWDGEKTNYAEISS